MKLKIIISALILVTLSAGLFFGLKNQTKLLSNYSDNEYLYHCSEPIRVKSVTYPVQAGSPSKGYEPINKNDAKQYCQTVGAY